MNPRTTAILFAVAAALGAFVYFYEIQGEEGRREAEAREKRLFPGLAAEDVEWLALRTRDGQDARAERRSGGWMLVEPLEFPGDDFALDAIASTLTEITSEAVYESPQDASVYGLEDSATRVRFGAGGVEYGLRAGDPTLMGGNRYAAVVGKEPVYAVKRFRVTSLEKSLDDLRDKRILDFDASAALRVTASWPGGRVALARADGVWRLTAPVEADADEETVADLLSDLSFLRAVSFADDPPPDSETGLDAPAFAVEIEVAASGAEVGDEASDDGGDADGDEGDEAPAAGPVREISFAVGSADVDGQRYVRAGRPTLYRISSSRLDDFPRERIAYRFKELAKFGVLQARKLELVFHPDGGEAVTLTATREGGQWSSEPEAIEPAKLRRMVEELSRLEARAVLAESAGPEEFAGLGLDPPRVTLVVSGEEGEDGAERLAEVRLGEVDGSEGIVAQRPGQPTVFEIDYELAEHLPVSLEALRNRFLVAETAEKADQGADPEAEANASFDVPDASPEAPESP